MDYMHLYRNWNNLLDILNEFECKPSIEDFVKYCELIKPRYYSLVNKTGENSKIILGSMSKQIDDKLILGHTTRFITNKYNLICANQSVEDDFQISYVLRKNILMKNLEFQNLICFCTGTGIAPMISLYNNRKQGQNFHLVYGFRNDEDDISKYFDLNCEIKKVKSSEGKYVTEYIDILDKYKDNGIVFICGNIKMQRAVFEKIKNFYPEIIEQGKLFFDNWQ